MMDVMLGFFLKYKPSSPTLLPFAKNALGEGRKHVVGGGVVLTAFLSWRDTMIRLLAFFKLIPDVDDVLPFERLVEVVVQEGDAKHCDIDKYTTLLFKDAKTNRSIIEVNGEFYHLKLITKKASNPNQLASLCFRFEGKQIFLTEDVKHYLQFTKNYWDQEEKTGKLDRNVSMKCILPRDNVNSAVKLLTECLGLAQAKPAEAKESEIAVTNIEFRPIRRAT